MASDIVETAAACCTALVVHLVPSSLLFWGLIRTGAYMFNSQQQARGSEKSRRAQSDSTCPAAKAIVHQSRERRAPKELPSFEALPVAFLALVGPSPSFSSPQCKQLSPAHTGVFPSRSSFGETHSSLIESCHLFASRHRISRRKG